MLTIAYLIARDAITKADLLDIAERSKPTFTLIDIDPNNGTITHWNDKETENALWLKKLKDSAVNLGEQKLFEKIERANANFPGNYKRIVSLISTFPPTGNILFLRQVLQSKWEDSLIKLFDLLIVFLTFLFI